MVSLTFKVSPEEARAIRAAARSAGRSVSSHIRHAVIRARPARAPKLRRDPKTGLPTLIMPAKTPPLTSEQVRAALADFP